MPKKGHIPNFKTGVACNLNWIKRIAGGFATTGWSRLLENLRKDPRFLTDVTPERKKQLQVIEQKLAFAQEVSREVIKEIDKYYTLPGGSARIMARQKALEDGSRPFEALEKWSRG